jgi:putative endonuclease
MNPPARRTRSATGVRTPRQRAGAAAEEAACALLRAHGCRVLARNVRYREGELDIVAQDGGLLLFIEVRLRTGTRFGGAAVSVDAHKRSRLARAAQHYLLQAFGDGVRRRWPPCRFDVITFDQEDKCDWIRNAFGEAGLSP